VQTRIRAAASLERVTVTEAAPDRGTPAAHLPIRTFHPRRGRMGPTRGAALDRLWPTRGHDIGAGSAGTPFDPAALFGRVAPLVLDIGCGMGDATVETAAADPARDYLGVDVHTPGLGNLLVLAERAGVDNVRAACGDAVEFLNDELRPGCLDAVHVFFPDPWPKARHHKRRIIRPDIAALISDRLRPGGVLHCATDWPEYAGHMLDVLGAQPALRNRYGGYAPRPPARPVTKFERRARAAGRDVFDLIFVRV
jgi:tRNA (guanine-N7-)-methyltransferase